MMDKKEFEDAIEMLRSFTMRIMTSVPYNEPVEENNLHIVSSH
jgi:hypothetical protein